MKHLFGKIMIAFCLTAILSCGPTSIDGCWQPVDKTKDWTEVVTMTVSHELGTFYGMEGMPQPSMKIMEETWDEWQPEPFGGIDGLEYIKGYEYVIKVEKTHLVNPPMDASSVRYKLKEIVLQEFRIGEGYTMHDDVLFYWETWDGDKGSYRELELSIIEDEHFIIIKEAEKGNAVDYLAEKGFSVMENSTDDPSKFLSHNGVKDCIQMTVKGTGNLDELPGSVYVAPLYYYVFSEPQSIIGRTNLLTVWFECQGNEDFFKRNIAWIQAYGEILGLITISTKEYFDHTDQSFWGYVSFAVTNQSAGNVVEIHNWFQEAARYEITDVEFPELASEPDND